MINSRVILLLALALIAVLAQIQESSAKERDGEKFAQLNKPGLSTRKVKKLLDSIERPSQFKIGKLTVWQIRTELDSTGSSVDDCQDASLARRKDDIEQLRSVSSVHNYANDRYRQLLKFCTKKSRQVMEGNRQLEILNVPSLEERKIREILRSIADKDNVKIGQVSIQEILWLGRRGGNAKDHCQREQILRYMRNNSDDSDLDMVSNVYKFLFARSPGLMSLCVGNVERVYRDNERLDKLYDESLTIEEAKNLLNSIEDKGNVRIGDISVRAILDRDNKSISVQDCLFDEFYKHRDYDQKVCNAEVRGVRKLVKAQYKRLLSVCAANLKEVFDMSISTLRGITKEDFMDKANEIRKFGKENAWWQGRDVCEELMKPFSLMTSIRVGADRYSVAIPAECSPDEEKWSGIVAVCEQFRRSEQFSKYFLPE